MCHIQAYYQNRTVIFKDLYDKQIKKKNPGINRFSESYLPFSNCSIIGNETVFSIRKGILRGVHNENFKIGN